jgi:8-oxo-dGTP pyrophosphatase MutT (NUDIX family)
VAAPVPRARSSKSTGARARKRAVARPASLPRHRQYGVIPVRFSTDGHLQVLLLTSRGSGRWVIPKGWPMRKRTPAGTAEREAYEEAGLKGWLWSRRPIGSYRYFKQDDDFTGEILVRVFVLTVERQKNKWPEKGERRFRWCDLRAAAALVKERELATLLRNLPRLLVGQEKVRPLRKRKKK